MDIYRFNHFIYYVTGFCVGLCVVFLVFISGIMF